MPTSKYTAGTIAIGAGATTVTGTGTLWASAINVRSGDRLSVAGREVTIDDVVSNTSLTLVDPWPGSAVAAGTSYKILQDSNARIVGAQAMADVSKLVAALSVAAVVVDPLLLAPDPSYGNEGQYAIQPTTNKYWKMVLGVWVLQGTINGVIGKTVTRLITSTGTYTPTPGMLFGIARGVGGGGGGGGVSITTTSQAYAGGGGGSGAESIKAFTAADIGASKPVTIGAGGTVSSGASGSTGGTTSLGSLLVATGGFGGQVNSPPTGFGQAGAGGSTSGGVGDVLLAGSPGIAGMGSGTIVFNALIAGNGGASSFGGAGQGAFSGYSAVGGGWGSLGGGGGGAAVSGNTAAPIAAGGQGGSGALRIDEFLPA